MTNCVCEMHFQRFILSFFPSDCCVVFNDHLHASSLSSSSVAVNHLPHFGGNAAVDVIMYVVLKNETYDFYTLIRNI